MKKTKITSLLLVTAAFSAEASFAGGATAMTCHLENGDRVNLEADSATTFSARYVTSKEAAIALASGMNCEGSGDPTWPTAIRCTGTDGARWDSQNHVMDPVGAVELRLFPTHPEAQEALAQQGVAVRPDGENQIVGVTGCVPPMENTFSATFFTEDTNKAEESARETAIAMYPRTSLRD